MDRRQKPHHLRVVRESIEAASLVIVHVRGAVVVVVLVRLADGEAGALVVVAERADARLEVHDDRRHKGEEDADEGDDERDAERAPAFLPRVHLRYTRWVHRSYMMHPHLFRARLRRLRHTVERHLCGFVVGGRASSEAFGVI